MAAAHHPDRLKFTIARLSKLEGIALNLDERERWFDLGKQNAMILRNHGLLVGGPTAANLQLIYFLAACTDRGAGPAECRWLSPEEVRLRQKQASKGYSHHQELACSSLRLIENDAIDYRS